MAHLKGIILHSPLFFKYFAHSSVQGITLYPFILVRHQSSLQDKQLIHHEQIHIQQQAELLVIPFYILYLSNYAINLLIYKKHYKAYRNICFEREAYDNEDNSDYLLYRHWGAWFKYLRTPKFNL
jgi:hypothetical protein